MSAPMFNTNLKTVVLVLAAASAASACTNPTDQQSGLSFASGASANLVVVEPADLSDTFLFGAIITDIGANTASDLLGANSDVAQQVKLQITTISGAPYLSINSVDTGLQLITFKVASQTGASTQVDFSDSPSRIQAVSNTIGIDASGTSATVTQVSQTKDTMAVDVAYTGTSTTAGNFTVRYWWVRRAPDSGFVARPNVDGLGFFTTAGLSSAQPIRSGNIDRLDLAQGPLKFTLVGFPADYVDVATQAIKAWELALGTGTIQVQTGTGNVGDPQSIVLRWYPQLPDGVSFAGLTYNSPDPSTGQRTVSGVLINGSPVEMYHQIYNGTQASYRAFLAKLTSQAASSDPAVAASVGAAPTTTLSIGALDLASNAVTMDTGEVLPFLPDDSVPFDTYIKGYYYGVVIHEVGHVMGLRHNFRGSLITDADTGAASSVMDYADRQQRYKATRIGSYDLAAVQYAYFGNQFPAQQFQYCSDEDMSTDPLCNQGDNGGDVAAYYHNSMSQLITYTSSYDFDLSTINASVTQMLANYKKVATLPSAQQAEAAADRQADLAALAAAKGQTATQQANMATLSSLVAKNLQDGGS